MVNAGDLFLAVGTTMLFLALLFSLFFWIYKILKLKWPDLRWTIKYNLLKRKHNEEDVKIVMDFIEKGYTTENDLKIALFLTNRYSKTKVNELGYIFKEINKKLKGGNKK